MASRAEKMVRVSSDSSSSDEEELKRCREAVWEARTKKAKVGDPSGKQESKRVVVADHDHDGNELQVTQGFQTHVAKKLKHLLDGCISETQPSTLRCPDSKCDEDHDEGFRLFSTSVPRQEATEPPPPVRHRPAPSSSDSDSEMEARLKEAAVSVSDLLPSSTRPSSSAEAPSSERRAEKQKVEEEEQHYVKKKTKQKQEEQKQEDSIGPASYHSNGEQGHSVVDKKRKKKKRHKRNTEEALN